MVNKLNKEDVEKIKNMDICKIRHLSFYQKVRRFRNRILEGTTK